MAVLDDDRRLIDANPAACRLLGLKSAQLVGRQLDEFIATDARGVFSEQWPALLRNGGDHAGYELERKDGSRAAIEFTATDQLAPGRYLWIIRDIEKQGGLSEPGRSNRRPMLDAQSVGGFGHWEWDLASGRMDWSAQARHIVGIEPTAAPSWDQTLELIHPDDRPGLVAVLEAAQTSRERFAHEYRVTRADGTFRVIESHGEIIAEAGGAPSRILGTVQDITDRRQAEIERRNLASVLDTSDDAITTCSLDGVFVTWNRGAEKLYGYTAQEAIGQPLDLIIPPGERATDHLNWERLLKDEPVRSLETVRVTKDGRTVVVSVTRSLIVDATRGVIGVASVGRDITQAKQAQALLAAAHADAVAASEMKSQFLENMSHEIRTPMNGVIGMNELLLDTELNDEQREYAEHIARSGEDMMVIINNVLDVSKIESGQLTLDVGEFALHETLEQACAGAKAEARAKGLSFELQIAEALPLRALGDARRIRQVLSNLVANAVKFTAEGEIAVRVVAAPLAAGNTRLRAEVADTGIGIGALALEHIFDPFTQADASLTRRYGGAGLGLAIARDLVELMGGTIGADSKPGHGSTFWFELDLGDCVF